MQIRRIVSGRRLRAAAGWAVAACAAPMLQACDNPQDTLLEAVDPDLINPSDVQSSEGAQALYVGTFGRLRQATSGVGSCCTGGAADGAWLWGGLLTDEWSTSSTFVQNDETDQRSEKEDNSTNTANFRSLQRVRTSANQAISGLREFRPADVDKVAEMYFQRGFAEMQLAQDYCNGIPVSEAAGDEVALGKPETVAQVFARAVASYDSAIALTSSATSGNAQVVNRAARVGKARALLGLGLDKANEAAALVAAATVPTTFSYDLTMSLSGGTNQIWGLGLSSRRYTVGDSIEGNARVLLVRNAIPFFSAKDPRLPVVYTTTNGGRDTTKAQDGFTFSRTTTRFDRTTSVAIVNGLDARLVEAEARLAANDFAGMTTILDALRAAPPKIDEIQLSATALPALTAPTTKDAAVNLFFREKAFWTFSRGQRLGDLRRLVRQYGRTADQAFPVGTHYRGGNYGADVNFPVPTEERTNLNFTGCIDRKA